ncbi:MAG: D-glycero-beta-D-manno-heptose 1-phosphate adenylyltransferase [Bacteroidales bacterium]|nr:D-glycero-beta-D-manno-heptose 1-phosphate adenylyltransferase [Bacteroidales bacterium]
METDFTRFIRSKIEVDPVLMTQQVARWRHRECPTVFVYGNFEEIDSRHVDYLAEAAGRGARLIAGVRTDEVIKRMYHYEPKKKQEDRALLLASMVFVSLVVFLNEEHPVELIRQIRPDILADYPEEVKIHPVAHLRHKIKERLESARYKRNLNIFH